MPLFQLGEGETAEQLVIVRADHIAAGRTKVAVAHEPAIDAVLALDIGCAVFEPRGEARREQVGRFGHVGVAIDDLDALEAGIETTRFGAVIDLAQHAAVGKSLVRPIFLG